MKIYVCISNYYICWESCYVSGDIEVTQEPDFDVRELSSTGRQLEVALGGAVQLACPPG